MNYPEIEITKEDLKKIIYFILMKFRGDPMHRQGTSSKRDFIGGYIERWVNKIPETVIFDELLKDKKYQVICDYFIYANDSEKNAPDILGLRKNEKVIPFAKYNNGTWETVKDMPRVEVKVVREDQSMVTIREQQMNDDYYVFVESNLDGNYLSSILDRSVFDEKYLKELFMSSDFIQSDINSQIIQHEKVLPSERIGTMKLIGIYTKQEVKDNSVLCGSKVSPYYFSLATNTSPRTRNRLNEPLYLDKKGRFVYKSNTSAVYLAVSIDIPKGAKIFITKKNKTSVYLSSSEDITISGINLKKGDIKIDFRLFERSSQWSENVLSKHIIQKYGEDSTQDLITLFDSIAEK